MVIEDVLTDIDNITIKTPQTKGESDIKTISKGLIAKPTDNLQLFFASKNVVFHCMCHS